MSTLRYTKEELESIVKYNHSIRGVLKSLKIIPAGGNYYTIKKYITLWNIDTSHFKLSVWNKGKKFPSKTPITNLLIKNIYTSTHRLGKRLIKENILSHQCSNCQLTTWLDNPIPLELHHKDGNRTNNELDNLCLLCPNCHTLTDNYRGKNINSKNIPKIVKQSKEKIQNYCSCGDTINRKSKMCLKCASLKQRKINWPDMDTLKTMLADSNYYRLGKELGVSDNAIRKHIKNNS